MGSRGDCWDNALAETFFASLKKELIDRSSWPSRAELRTAVFEYIEIFYNATRRHSTLGMRSPNEYEKLREHEQTEQIETQPRVSTETGKDQGRITGG